MMWLKTYATYPQRLTTPSAWREPCRTS